MRLDEIRHPYGPSPAALEALQPDQQEAPEALSERLRIRLSETHRIPHGSIALFAGAECGIYNLLDGSSGPLVTFPPAVLSSQAQRWWPSRDHVLVARGLGAESSLESGVIADIPPEAVALIDAPSNPLGTVLAPRDAVRLARACRGVVIDERYTEFAGLSLLALAAEFDNVVVVRSFETWAGLERSPCAWAAVSPKLAEVFGVSPRPARRDAIAAALATLDCPGPASAMLRVLQDERSRLYRLLRKLSFINPAPSRGPFLTARVSIGQRSAVVRGLRERGIRVHAPREVGLERFVRFGIGTRSEMETLRLALLELAPELVS